jgi:Ser/Thr protein kinase RdoA (MazF antagonist)
VEALAAEFEARLAPVERELRRGIVHDDAHCGNILFNDGRAVGLIDFDGACPGYLLADLAVQLGTWGLERSTRTLAPEKASLLVREYEKRRPLRAEEWELLPDFLAMYLLADAAQGIGDETALGKPSDVAVAEDQPYRAFRNLTAEADWRERMRRSITR